MKTAKHSMILLAFFACSEAQVMGQEDGHKQGQHEQEPEEASSAQKSDEGHEQSPAAYGADGLLSVDEGFYVAPFVGIYPRRSLGLGLGLGYIIDALWQVELSAVNTDYSRGRMDYESWEVGVDVKHFFVPWFAAIGGLNYQKYSEDYHQPAQWQPPAVSVLEEDGDDAAPQKQNLGRGIVDQGLWLKLGLGARFDYTFPYLSVQALSVGGQFEVQFLLHQISEISEDFHPLGGRFLGLNDAFFGARIFVAFML